MIKQQGVRDILLMHFIVFIWSFTGILGRLVEVKALELVTLRSLIAFLAIGILMWIRKMNTGMNRRQQWQVIAVGTLIGFHWVCFFGSIQVSNVSMGLAGLSTGTLWTSILEPMVVKRKIRPIEVVLGLIVIAGLYLIFQYELEHFTGLILGILAAFLSALFSVFNGLLAPKYNHYAITYYEMLGAFLGCAFVVIILSILSTDFYVVNIVPSGIDWILILVLALVCTVYPFAATVELMKRLSVFTVNLTVNLEPIYGIIMAILIFNENEQMSIGFYAGTMIILTAVIIHPFINRYQRKRSESRLQQS